MKSFINNRQSQIRTLTKLLLMIGVCTSTEAKNPYKKEFLNTYPVKNTQLDILEGINHCGICHYDFNGGGSRNPYGLAVEAQLATNGNDISTAFAPTESLDSDGDGKTNIEEINDLTGAYTNTPTFPGLSAANVSSITHMEESYVTPYLTPSDGTVDTDPPEVHLTSPAGGETETGNAPMTITWTATDPSGIAGINLYISLDDGASFKPIALNLLHTGSFEWFVSNRPSSNAVINVEAIDNAGNIGHDENETVFIITAPPGGTAPTTLRDFDLPGSQPIEHSGLVQADPDSCAQCHGNYNEAHEPYRNWMGSMMAQASIDPLFKANMSIANQDAPDSGDLCLKCHNSRGWLDGRSTPTDGSQMTDLDQRGVSCDLCHRMVDPIYAEGISPIEDTSILANLNDIPPTHANGMFVFDPNSHRRGPFDDTPSLHTDIYSPFHQQGAFCGTCHDVSNPVFERDGTNMEYVANNFDEAPIPSHNTSEILMPVERTYSEWLHSAYNSSNGVYAPQFAGNKDGGMVSTCQDCHMPDILGHGANPNMGSFTVSERADLPLHDMTGGSTWLPNLLPEIANLSAEEAAAISNGTLRATYMLQKAARMQAEKIDNKLEVMVINDTGHKLPTGYPEGRRMWINLCFYDADDNLILEKGGYDYATGLLTNDTMIYEVHPGIGTNLAAEIGVEPGPSLHFVLNNQIYEDNRIPPRGFSNEAFDTFGGKPVGHHYDDGQFWDNVSYEMPDGAVRAHAKLYYQSTSKEFIEFLRDENTTDDNGEIMYNLWVENDRCPPVLMTEAFWPENFNIYAMAWSVDETLGIAFNSISGYTYWIEYADDLTGSNAIWKPFISNGILDSLGGTNLFTDDFTPATSGEAPDGQRFYRIRR